MSIDDLIAAIERRGYTIEQPKQEPMPAGYTTLCILRADAYLLITVSQIDLESAMISVGELAEYWLRSFAKGQHHMCCTQCKEPLLHQQKRGVFYRGEIVPMTRELAQELRPVMPLGLYQEQSVDEYRNAKAGPDSEVLTACSGCGVALDGNTEEIIDE